MIHRSIARRLRIPLPDIPFLAFETSPSSLYSIWIGGNLVDGAVPRRLDTTQISSLSGITDLLADIDPYPAAIVGNPILYSRVGHGLSPAENSVRVVAWDDSTNDELFREAGAIAASLQPEWAPDASQIVFRAKATSGTRLAKIKVMDADGSNVQTLYEAPAGGEVVYPLWNHDGSKIAWLENPSTDLIFPRRLKVMDADGSNVSDVYVPGGNVRFRGMHSLANTQNTAAMLMSDDATFTGNQYIRRIDLDGTDLTTLLTIVRSSGYVSSDADPGLTKWSWLPDDSEIAWNKQTPLLGVPTTPEHHFGFVDAVSGGFTAWSPAVDGWTAGEDDRPTVLASRIYFQIQTEISPGVLSGTQLGSVALDGTDFVIEHDGDDPGSSAAVRFQGFKGDSTRL